MRNLLFILSVCFSLSAYGQKEQEDPIPVQMTPEMTESWSPQPPVVIPGNRACDTYMAPPSDAIVLFDGTGLSQWEGAPDKEVLVQGKDMSMFKSSAGGAARWSVEDGVLLVNKEAGDIQTKLSFGDFQLHIEWRIPEEIHGEGQLRGNSGIFLQNIYELQILDSYKNETYVNGQAGSIYKQTPPRVNAMRQPGAYFSFRS